MASNHKDVAAAIYETAVPPIAAIPLLQLARWRRSKLPKDLVQIDTCMTALTTWWPDMEAATAQIFESELEPCWDIFAELKGQPEISRLTEDMLAVMYFILFLFRRAERQLHPSRPDIDHQFVDYGPHLFRSLIEAEVARLVPSIADTFEAQMETVVRQPSAEWHSHLDAFASLN